MDTSLVPFAVPIAPRDCIGRTPCPNPAVAQPGLVVPAVAGTSGNNDQRHHGCSANGRNNLSVKRTTTAVCVDHAADSRVQKLRASVLPARAESNPTCACWVWNIYSSIVQETETEPAGDWLPPNVAKLQREIQLAVECGAHTLAAIGLRAAIEAVCIDRRCKGSDLQKRIARLNGILRADDVHLLQTQRALGNEAAHQMHTPSAAELDAARQLLDNTLRTLYEMPRRAEDFKRLRAARLADDAAKLQDAC